MNSIVRANSICWICHQQQTENKIFQPCLCKGSMSFVHQNCISQWATGKYGNQLLKDNFNPQHDVKCPNCKFKFKFQVIESRQVEYFIIIIVIKRFIFLRLFDSKEKITLFILIVIQFIVLTLELGFQKMDEPNLSESGSKALILHITHIGTVIILLMAAIYNMIEMVMNRTQIIIGDGEFSR